MKRLVSLIAALCLTSSCTFAASVPPPAKYLLIYSGCLPTASATNLVVSGGITFTTNSSGGSGNYYCNPETFASKEDVDDFLDQHNRDGYVLMHIAGVPEDCAFQASDADVFASARAAGNEGAVQV